MKYKIGLGVALAAALLSGGCGGDDNSGKQPSTAATDYASCLRANGVTLPTGGLPGGNGRPSGDPRPSGQPRPSGSLGRGGGFGGQVPNGVDPSAWAKAQEACRGVLPSGGPGFGGPGGPGGEDSGAAQAYRNCLSDHGVTQSGPAQDLDESDPKVAAAVQACAALRPSRGPRPSRSG